MSIQNVAAKGFLPENYADLQKKSINQGGSLLNIPDKRQFN
jgi:hypothetical protein